MTEKSKIIQELGEENLLLPTLVSKALKANDRIKYFLTLLQAARNHADNPNQNYSNLRAERESVGVSNPDFDNVILVGMSDAVSAPEPCAAWLLGIGVASLLLFRKRPGVAVA